MSGLLKFMKFRSVHEARASKATAYSVLDTHCTCILDSEHKTVAANRRSLQIEPGAAKNGLQREYAVSELLLRRASSSDRPFFGGSLRNS